ncbi:hypothetical protein P154DRAFT_571649 [Amniculicola lignicola CBS 123094]|uniref:Uncharacterized protein n=1 Tax=Amniculicola lignicola CBS 123094 TaxID=1392246 RepID=A0A6A5X249_9PLEO|nr:hypothetical protein P154DRAFT_571649 [Amniculicola lignicola CBS 123094]
MESHLGKRQRLDSFDGSFGPPLAALQQQRPQQAQQQQQQGYQYPPSQIQAPQSRSITQDEAWKSILGLDEAYIRETLFHVVVSNTSPAEALGKVVDMHTAKVRAEEDQKRREGERVIDFSHYAVEIANRLENEPIDIKPCRISYEVFSEEIMPPINEIKEQASRPGIAFATRASGLETLRKIGEEICLNISGGLGCEIAGYFSQDDAIIEEAMKSILKAMTPQERRQMCHSKYEDKEWWQMIKELLKMGAEDREKLFQKLDEILEMLLASDQEASSQRSTLQSQRVIATPTGARPGTAQSQSSNAAAQAYHAAQNQAQIAQMQQHQAQQQHHHHHHQAQQMAQHQAQLAQQARQAGQPQHMAQHQTYQMLPNPGYRPPYAQGQGQGQAQGYHPQSQAYQLQQQHQQQQQQQQTYQQDPRAAAYQGPTYSQASSATYYINGHLVTYGGQPPH